MICPIRTSKENDYSDTPAEAPYRTSETIHTDAECVENKCAWWVAGDGSNPSCAVTQIGREMGRRA